MIFFLSFLELRYNTTNVQSIYICIPLTLNLTEAKCHMTFCRGAEMQKLWKRTKHFYSKIGWWKNQ